jgi:hypothetical protein
MNDYDETARRTTFDSGGRDTGAYAELTGRRPPIVVGSGTAIPEIVEPSPSLAPSQEPKLSTADIAGRNKPAPGASASAALAQSPEPIQPSDQTLTDEPSGPLFTTDEARDFRVRWDAIQASFVDEPRRSVEQADNLVAETIKRLAEVFADERHRLEGQWTRGESVSTEDLRLALRRYRSFFGRLLSV